jgi:hypothetical protein
MLLEQISGEHTVAVVSVRQYIRPSSFLQDLSEIDVDND